MKHFETKMYSKRNKTKYGEIDTTFFLTFQVCFIEIKFEGQQNISIINVTQLHFTNSMSCNKTKPEMIGGSNAVTKLKLSQFLLYKTGRHSIECFYFISSIKFHSLSPLFLFYFFVFFCRIGGNIENTRKEGGLN